MQLEVPVPIQSQVVAFLAAHDGVVHSGDVGPLIAYGSWMLECRDLDERVPAGWHEALNAALTDLAATCATPDSRSAAAWVAPTETPPVPPGVATLRRAGLPFAAH